MKILSLVISGFVFMLGVVFGKNTNTPNPPEQLGAQTVATPSATVQDEPTATIKPTTKTTPTNSPRPTNAQQPAPSNFLNDFRYPGSSIVNQSDLRMTLTSTDDPSTITGWYDAQLIAGGFSSRSTAKTNTNGNILNKLGGGKNKEQIMITIQKNASSQAVTITVSRENDSSDGSVHIKIENNSSSI